MMLRRYHEADNVKAKANQAVNKLPEAEADTVTEAKKPRGRKPKKDDKNV